MQPFDRFRIGLTLVVALGTWSLLLWQHFHGGVPAHYLFADPEMPRVSNAWGALLLPALTWGLLGLSRRRIQKPETPGFQSVVIGLVAGAAFGLALSISFVTGYESVSRYLFYGLLPLALLLPVYRPECLLGFVLGASTALGAVLPTAFGTVMALATLVVHRFVGLPLLRLVGLKH